MTLVVASGSGIAFVVYEISPQMAENLREGSLSIDQFYDLLESDELNVVLRECGLTSDLVISVNGIKYNHSLPNIEFSEDYDLVDQIGGAGEYYLIVSTREKGDWFVANSDQEFDPIKLTMSRTLYIINGIGKYILTDIDYDERAELSETDEKGSYCMVIYPDGQSYEVQFMDEEE